MIIENRKGNLYFDGCDTVSLAKKYGTPLYVYSQTEMVSRINELKDCFIHKYKNTRVAYASKALNIKAILKLMEKEDLSLDVVSGGELYTAIDIGFPAERIEFNGNNKLPEELDMAIEYGVGRIIIDGLQELKLIEEICQNKNKKVNVLYRITPGVKSDSHDYIVTGKKDSKFGIPLDDDVFYPAIKDAIDSDWVNFYGLHFHVGSQLFDNTSHLKALDIILDYIEEIKKRFNYEIKELNVGGGFGIQYTDEERKPYSYFLDPMMEKIESYFKKSEMNRPSIVIEPGRSIVGEAGITLYTVGSIKDISGVKKYVSVDGGMTDNIRPALYEAKYHGVIANKFDKKADDLVSISGKCCESGDILIEDIKIPLAEAGDILAVFSTGAYGYSMANNYNKNPIPAAVLVKDGKDSLIIKRQSYKDMIKNEILASWM
ncbi:MAG: diaminopimelate decarboxylase [Tissierella sp.]|uniref:diaminopimelate decarboxylase n=1 Tax=Tissierella sp. TaxID=41274 RepID=UPI003F99D2B1